jgi:hypothetical protein
MTLPTGKHQDAWTGLASQEYSSRTDHIPTARPAGNSQCVF